MRIGESVLLLSAGADQQICVLDIRNNTVATLAESHSDTLQAIKSGGQAAKSQSYVYSSDRSGTLKVWRLSVDTSEALRADGYFSISSSLSSVIRSFSLSALCFLSFPLLTLRTIS